MYGEAVTNDGRRLCTKAYDSSQPAQVSGPVPSRSFTYYVGRRVDKKPATPNHDREDRKSTSEIEETIYCGRR
jgi:hypothetical protein